MLRLFLIAFVWYFIGNLGIVLSDCPFGWQHYNSSCYFFSSEKLDWYYAEFACRAHDARLVEIETKDRQDFIADIAKHHPHARNYWTGGRDDVTEGRWIWSSTDQPITFTNWGPHEPSNRTDQNCIAIHAATNWKWVDGTCSETTWFICEKKYHNSGEIVG
ncbi:perlucin-like protein [Mytilus edulis]|uniref:perlucin-like protein n=1 Tax=Mytilus edulis TaxID=6550 RepID=UPI0039EF6098